MRRRFFLAASLNKHSLIILLYDFVHTGYGIYIGQNLAWGYQDWPAAIKGWYDEVGIFKYGPDPDSYLGSGGWPAIGHYIQVTIERPLPIISLLSTLFVQFFGCHNSRKPI